MASTVPVKSNNPLHNFDLPHLKWKKNHHHHSNNNNHHHHHHRRRSTNNKLSSDSSSPSRHDSPLSHSPMRESLAAARHSPLRDPVRRESSPIAPVRRSPLRDSVAPVRRRSPMRDSAAAAVHQSPMRESVAAVRRSPMLESVAAVRRSPMTESVAAAANRSPMRESVAGVRRSPMRESVAAAAHRSPARESVSAVRRRSPMHDSVPPRQSPMRSESVPESENRRTSRISAPESTKKGTISDKSSDTNKKHKVPEYDASGNKEGMRSKILIKIPRKNNKAEEIQEEQKVDESQEEGKTWNLRPRKPIHKSLNINSGVPFRSITQEGKAQSAHVTNVNNKAIETTNESQKKVKRQRFSIALSREEIDEDMYAMTGSKASRRPKKRVKAVQKQLDTLFPGLWLASITPDSYKVCENLPKG